MTASDLTLALNPEQREAAEHLTGPMLVLAISALSGYLVPLWYLLAVIMAAIGIVTERWLFFAEAEHVSMLFYGAERV